jgi:transcriptional regulator GlxA family with amidase domain
LRILAGDETAVPSVAVRRSALNGTGGPRLASWQERKAKKFMFAHFSESVDIGEIARICRMSRGYFISAFCASTGLTPHQWLICFRIRLAQELLLSTDRSLGLRIL